MSNGTSSSVVNLGEISKPADTLIKKVSKAIGGVFHPYQIKRVAMAEAEASLIKAHAEIQVTDLHRRAMHRFVEEEALKQQNMEQITTKAMPLLKEGTDAGKMEDDWVTNFFDKSRIVSDQEMQELWSKVLAGEANAPGTYSKRTVNFLGDFDKTEAETFRALCRFSWQIGKPTPLIFDVLNSIYNNAGINFASLNHLDSIGLIHFDNIAGYRKVGLPKKFALNYFEKYTVFEFPNDINSGLEIGKVLLTRTGDELVRVCESEPVPEFKEYVEKHWNAFIPQAAAKQNPAASPPSTAAPGN